MNLISNSDHISTSAIYSNDPYIAHHGIKGMKWGVRRFQNEDGSLKPAGEGRYDGGRRFVSNPRKVSESQRRRASGPSVTKRGTSGTRQNSSDYKTRKARARKAAKVGLAVAGTALAAYGGYKLYKHAKDKKSAAEAADMARKMKAGEEEFSRVLSQFKQNAVNAGATRARGDFRMPDGSVRVMTFDKASGTSGWMLKDYYRG